MKNCTILSTSPQGYINMALFTGIVGLLFTGTLAIGEYVVHNDAATLPVTAARPGQSSTPSAKERHATNSAMSGMDQRVLFVASLVFYPLLWTFWVTAAITTSILCADAESKWDTLNAACAFTWLSWLATSGSCYIVGYEAWEGRSGRASADDTVGEERGRCNVTAEEASVRKSALRSSGGSGLVDRSGAAAMTTSAGSGLSRGHTQSGRSRERGVSTDTGRQSGRRKDRSEEITGEVTSRVREMRTRERKREAGETAVETAVETASIPSF